MATVRLDLNEPCHALSLIQQQANLAISKIMKCRQWFIAALFLRATTGGIAAQERHDPAAKVLALEEKWNDAHRRSDIAPICLQTISSSRLRMEAPTARRDTLRT
jgi:hypothetical protein